MLKLFNLILFLIFITVENSNEFSLKSTKNDMKIVGGYETSIENYPYIVSIHFADQHRCGGAIIQDNCILTASHCLIGRSSGDVLVHIGSSYSTEGGQFYQVEKIIMHENYDRYTLENDIALLFLKRSLYFSDTTQPIKLPALNQPLKFGEKATTCGWGLTSEGSKWDPKTKLRAVNITIISRVECNRIFARSYWFLYDIIKNGMFCAGESEGGLDSCQGDSGGPIVFSNEIIGIVSWGFGCAKPNQPGVYTNVAAYINWINENLKLKNNIKFFM